MRNTASSITEADLHGFVDGQLLPDRCEMVAGWLASRPRDAARVESWRQQNAALSAAFGKIAQEPLPVSLSLNVTAASRYSANPAQSAAVHRVVSAPVAAQAEQFIPVSSGLAARSGFTGFLLGLSLALGAGGLGLLAMETWKPQWLATRGNDGLWQRALEAHQLFAADRAHGWEMSAARPTELIAWLSERTGLALNAPDLTPEGLRLAGGRVLPGESAPMAMLVYEDAGGQRTSLFITASGDHSGNSAQVKSAGPLTILVAATALNTLAIVSPGSRDLIGRIVKSVEIQTKAAR